MKPFRRKQRQIRPNVLFGLLAIGAIFSFPFRTVAAAVFVSGFPPTQRAEEARNCGSLPSLSGATAIEYLKQNREYDTFMEAFEATRREQTDERPDVDAFGQRAKLTARDGAAFDYFGQSVTISGETAIIGAPWGDVGANANQGSAYVFVRSGTTWSEQQKLTAADGAVGDLFGMRVAISGDTAIVGALLDDVGENTDQGSAYIFVRSGTTWSEQQKLTASDGAVADKFGSSVAMSGETAIVGASSDDVGENTDQGSAYIFVRSGTTWSEQQKLAAADGAVSDFFSVAVAISGDSAIVGAPGDNVGANANQGSAYIFVRFGSSWSEQQKLTAADGALFDGFGGSVGISGETAIVGASNDDVGGNFDQGSAYVFVRSGTTWSKHQKLTAADGAGSNRFGTSVSIWGDTAIVGAAEDDVGTNNDQGSAYIFVRSGTMWNQQQKLSAADGAEDDNFGKSVAISGDTVVVGAYFDAVGANTSQGSAYVFTQPTPANIGTSFDFDGDGRADISVFRSSDTAWYLNRSTDGFSVKQFGLSTDKITPADLDGDSKTDIAVYRAGIWYWLNSSNGTFGVDQFGLLGDVPLPVDYTGDGRDDLAIYRDGVWWTKDLTDGQTSAIQFGLTSDRPVPADYDGDGRVDQGVYRDGVWHLNRSSLGYTSVQFGLADDRLVVGDYDGDGKADQAVYRDGVWYLLQSSLGFTAFQFGIATDVPAPADYDGDGKTDVAVYRDGVWYLLQSTSGFAAQQFGLQSDRPVPAAYLP